MKVTAIFTSSAAHRRLSSGLEGVLHSIFDGLCPRVLLGMQQSFGSIFAKYMYEAGNLCRVEHCF